MKLEVLLLAPPAYALKIRSRESFEAIYRDQLDRLDAKKVYTDLGPDTVLLWYEKPGEYCHRRLAAAWLEEKLGIQVPELRDDEGRWVRKIPRTLSLFQL